MRSAGRDSGRCALMTSVSCEEGSCCTGLSEFIAPWNTIDTCCQRKARSSAGVIDSTSRARPSRSCPDHLAAGHDARRREQPGPCRRPGWTCPSRSRRPGRGPRPCAASASRRGRRGRSRGRIRSRRAARGPRAASAVRAAAGHGGWACPLTDWLSSPAPGSTGVRPSGTRRRQPCSLGLSPRQARCSEPGVDELVDTEVEQRAARCRTGRPRALAAGTTTIRCAPAARPERSAPRDSMVPQLQCATLITPRNDSAV